MELYEFKNKVLELLNVKIEELSDALMAKALSDDYCFSTILNHYMIISLQTIYSRFFSFILKANSKEEFPELLLLAFKMWKQRVMMLNNDENILLAELRDALLPDLMSGKIEI